MLSGRLLALVIVAGSESGLQERPDGALSASNPPPALPSILLVGDVPPALPHRPARAVLLHPSASNHLSFFAFLGLCGVRIKFILTEVYP